MRGDESVEESMDSETSLSNDDMFFLLSSRRRRFVLRYLRRTGRGVDRSVLVEELAAWENDVDVESLSKQQRRTVDVSLYQTHFKELTDADVITYDADAGRVEPTDRIEEFAGYLDRWREDGLDVGENFDPRDDVRETADMEDRSREVAGTSEDADVRELRPLHYLGIAGASLGLYVAVILDSGVIWRVPLFVAAIVVIGIVAVHAYPLYSLGRRGPFRAK